MPNEKILLIEDERDLVFLLKSNLRREGYNLVSARTAESGLALARKHKPDLIVLDVMLPKMDGFELIKVLRRETSVPVLFLTARKSEIDRVLGLKLGADDYVTKPFSVQELAARIQAILHRARHKEEENGNGVARFGALEVDFDRHEVRVNGKYRDLAPREFQLLKLLIDAKGKVLSRDHLLECIWGVDKGMEVSTRTVDQHIARLRRKLAGERERIVTVTNFGYQIKMR
jgi:two-component system, OmpR family, alkaline phosphatase synthesis response regulator PhoP